MGKHSWTNYFLAAYKGVFEHLAARGQAAPAPLGLQIMIHGTVPTGACCACPALCCAVHAAVQLSEGAQGAGGATPLNKGVHLLAELDLSERMRTGCLAVPACLQVEACPAQQPSCAPALWLSCACTGSSSQRG